jgi:hypothetical protein
MVINSKEFSITYGSTLSFIDYLSINFAFRKLIAVDTDFQLMTCHPAIHLYFPSLGI